VTGRRESLPGAVLSIVGASVLAASLFLVWSHQLPPAETHAFHGGVLFGVAANPTAWQVYAIAAEVLAVLAIAVAAAGLWGQRPVRAAALGAVGLGLAFVIHASSAAPTNGLLLSSGTGSAVHYLTDPASTGPGETVALVGLSVAAIGLALSFIRLPRSS
jgi:hypothetical protein